jgi:hypothetical protein
MVAQFSGVPSKVREAQVRESAKHQEEEAKKLQKAEKK